MKTNTKNMKKSVLFITLFAAFCSSIFSHENYPFTVKMSGNGNKSIVFIPGFACSGDVWNETILPLEARFKCHVLTLSGFAGNPAEAEPGIKHWVDQIASYIRENKLDKPVIIGHSLGGLMAEWLAADYPELVSQIIVVDALPCLAALSNPDFKTNEKPDCSAFEKSFTAIAEESFYKMQKTNMAMLVADTSKIETVARWSVQSDRRTMARIYCQFLNSDLRDKLKTISCPALILLETNFKGLNTQITGQYKNLQDAKLVYAGKGLHFIMYDDKEWYFQQMKTFLK
jgi:pimeloyl-ACP methyl ester carboxylesterase